MLRITQQNSAQGAKEYYATADYYSEGQEIIGLWGGKTAKMLGLEGTVDKQAFDRLCDNLDPRDGTTPLTVRTRSQRTVGYDFTFSVPKSVSLLYARTGDYEILDAFRSAVDETMRDIESEMQTRVRSKGRDENRQTGNMVWAEFVHTTSRPVDGIPDPQLHAHCFAFNVTHDPEEQRFKAGQFRELKRDAPYFQARFRVRLAGKLQELGFAVERKRDDFELAGVPASAIKRFSRRTDEIEKKAAELGITDPGVKSELGAYTRQKKVYALQWDDVRQEWESRLTDEERQALDSVYARKGELVPRLRGEAAAVTHAIDHCFVREAVVPERKLMTEALKRGLGAVTIKDVERELAKRPLIRGLHEGRPMATTPGMRDAEARLIEMARDGRGKLRPVGDGERAFTHEWLNAGQKEAVRHVIGSRDLVTVVRGAAGTGKTTLENELRLALEEASVPVAALAQSTGAVDELREKAGFQDAATIARFFKDTRMQASIRGGLLLVDEASLIGTQDMNRLFAIANQAEARIVLVGDRRQHRSVSAGEPLRLLEDRAGLPVAEVTEIIRQEHGDYKKAAEALSVGKTEEGFAELDKLGWIREISHAGRYWILAQAYLSAMLEKKQDGKPMTALVVSPTHAEIARITSFIRNALKQDKKLGDEHVLDTWVSARLTDPEKADAANFEPENMLQFHQNAPGHVKGSRLAIGEGTTLPVNYPDRFEVYRPSQLALAAGDRVRITVNGKTKDGKHRLNNGDLLTVKGFTAQGDPIVDNGWVIAKDFGHLAYGYAVTSNAAQGKSVDKVFIGESSLSFGATNQRSFYVPVTRGKKQAVIFTDNKEELLRAVKRPDQPISATEFAANARRKPGIRSRLQKHLASLRRAFSFSQVHASPSLSAERAHIHEQ
ncbi:MAG TPA: MobF family relaxase [Gemmataceae bacterium]|jgi:conjugative relaxase-like TrwC/TraI family protein|nr:MobF family relaxase [Gemmataceae bacterium]